LTEYDKLLEDARAKAEAFKSTAKEYTPKMYRALRNENPTPTPEDARDRIEKDCFDIWSKRTILDALPDEAKDLEKQKAG
jgi:predicted secreted Zn-dependent protease